MPAGPGGPWTKPFEEQTTEDLWAGVVSMFIWLLMPILFIAMTFRAETSGPPWGIWLVRGVIALIAGGVAFCWVFPRIRELRRRRAARSSRKTDDGTKA